MRVAQALVLTLVATLVFAGSASSTHDPKARYSGRYDLDPFGKAPGKLSLRLVSESAGMAAYKSTIVVTGPECRGVLPAQWYFGSFQTPTDGGPVVGCSDGSFHGFIGNFKSKAFGGKVGRLNIDPPRAGGKLFDAQTTAAGDYSAPYQYFPVPIRFDKHFAGDGAGEEDDKPECNGKQATIVGDRGAIIEGTNGDDVIVGTSVGEEIRGHGGEDTICGLGGSDKIDLFRNDSWPTGFDVFADGGAGNDHITGSQGSDILRGGAGNDSIDSTNANALDRIEGGPGDDTIRIFGVSSGKASGGSGDDKLSTTDADAELYGDSGNDQLAGARRAAGGAGNDQIIGSSRNDFLIGDDGVPGPGRRYPVKRGDGNDVISGAGGDDVLYGQGGRDRADGGDGRDACSAEKAARCEIRAP